MYALAAAVNCLSVYRRTGNESWHMMVTVFIGGAARLEGGGGWGGGGGGGGEGGGGGVKTGTITCQLSFPVRLYTDSE